MPRDRTSAVRIAVLYPETLGTYGDAGNAVVLGKRLTWRGIPAETIEVPLGTAVPETCDIYLLGGGEDAAQAVAARALAGSPGLFRAVGRGAVVLAVCAGFQLLGSEFAGPNAARCRGLGLLDARSVPLSRRAVGEALVDATPFLDQELTGFENHAYGTELGPEVSPLGRMRKGTGNDSRTDGAVQGRVVGTYLHGPLLARNPALADLLLSWAVGPLPKLAVEGVDTLREQQVTRARTRR